MYIDRHRNNECIIYYIEYYLTSMLRKIINEQCYNKFYNVVTDLLTNLPIHILTSKQYSYLNINNTHFKTSQATHNLVIPTFVEVNRVYIHHIF